MFSRRQFLYNATLAALAGCGLNRPEPLPGRGEPGYPFTLGIASGDPDSGSVILWTRFAPEPLRDTSLADAVPVHWVIAEDAEFRRVVQRGDVVALPENAHCVHVMAGGLEPDRHYYYRFDASGYQSPVGRTRTLPLPGAGIEEFRIALTSCQEYSQGYFTAYRDVVAQNPNLVIHNGDYIYEAPSGHIRPYPIPGEALALADYRKLYAQYRQDAHLRNAHALLPWIVLWDDHEVVNDWGPEHFLPSSRNAPMSDGAYRVRQRDARKAFLEHMPLRAALSGSEEPVFYEQNVIGKLLELNRLDVRSYRDRPVCIENLDKEFADCPDAHDPQRSLLGSAQEAWLYEHFGTSGCRWNCLVQATVMAPFDRKAGPEVLYETDGWDNYAANRARLVEHIHGNAIPNCVSLGGNIHTFYAGTVTLGSVQCEPALTELVTTSITASGGAGERYDDVNGRREENPCMAYFDNRQRGYTLLEFSHERIVATLRVVDDVTIEDSPVTTLATLAVHAGNAEIVRGQ